MTNPVINPVAAFAGLAVNDLSAAKTFYTTTLGLTAQDERMGLTLALPGGGTLFLYEKANHEPATYTAVNLLVTDIDAAVADLTAAGVLFERYDNLGAGAHQDETGILRGQAAGMGPDIAWFKDPAGNIVAVMGAM